DSWDDGEEYDEDEEDVLQPPADAGEEEEKHTKAAPVPHKGYLAKLLEHIGSDPFRPDSASDLDVALAAAERLRPVLRRQSNGVWIERGSEKWTEIDKEAPKRALARMSALVPLPSKSQDEMSDK